MMAKYMAPTMSKMRRAEAILEQLEQLPEPEAIVVEHSTGYTITIKSPGADMSNIEVLVDGDQLVVAGQTLIVDESMKDSMVVFNWQIPVELPIDAHMLTESKATIEHNGETAVIEVPKVTR